MSEHKPPSNLTPKARRWWSEIEARHGFADDPGTRRILDLAAELMSKAEQYDAEVRRAGAMVKTKNGPKTNPLIDASHKCNTQFLAALRALGLAQSGKAKAALPGSRYAPRPNPAAHDLSNVFAKRGSK
jgi:hypothetical protein